MHLETVQMRWDTDEGHSIVEFGVKHLGISTTKGRFRKFEGWVETDEQSVPESLEVTIDAASVDTNQPDRDQR